MADAIGVRRKWHQGDHYDICLAKRSLAVERGAKEVTQRELVKIIRGDRMSRVVEAVKSKQEIQND